MNDVRKYIYGTLIVFVVGIFLWVSFIFVNACGFTLTCNRGAPLVDRTPIPTLLLAAQPAVETGGSNNIVISDQCHIAALDLIGAWVENGSSETEPFQFTDINGQNCESNFEEVQPLFLEANFWYSGSLSCVSCHSVDVTISPAQLDLSSYAGIMSGSRRVDAESKGADILGGKNWDDSVLYEFLSMSQADIPGHAEIDSELVIFAGKPVPTADPTPTPAQ